MVSTLPHHVAFIVDGNRRWAKTQGKSAVTGHRWVVDHTLDAIVNHCLELGIPFVTFWAFSTENWKRGARFAQALFKLLQHALDSNAEKYLKAGIKLNTIGDLSKVPADLARAIEDREQRSQENTKCTVTIALNYGGRDEIVRAIKKMLLTEAFTKQNITALTEADFSHYLDTATLPDPDLIIRTGGEQRLSGFLPWQSQYAELYFTPILMPDFTIEEFDKALAEFSNRHRRFGK